MTQITTLLKAIYPARDAIDVPVKNAKIKLEFSNAMQSSSLNEKTITLKTVDEQTIEVSYSYHQGSRILTLTPTEQLATVTSYTVEIKGGINGVLDIFSNHYYKDYYAFSFLTGADEPGKEEVNDGVPPIEDGEEKPPIQDDEENEETPVRNTLSVLGTYPLPGEILRAKTDVVLAFSFPLDDKDLEDKITLKEKPLSPLLVDTNSGIPLTFKLSEDKKRLAITPGETLSEGFEYVLTLSKGILASGPTEAELKEDYHLSFTTTWQRSYTNVKLVRLLAGSFADSFTDNDIIELIARESNALYYRIQRTPNFNDSEWAIELAPFGAEQYVRFSVVYQMALGQTLETSSGQRSDIKLGDLSVGAGNSVSSSVGDILSLLKDELARWWRILKGEVEEEDALIFVKGPGTATRAGDNYTYPEFQKRVPFSDLGG